MAPGDQAVPPLTLETWQEVRAAYEVGATFSDLGRRFGISRQAIAKRAKAEGWQIDPEAAAQIRERVAVKVTSDPAKKDQAIEAVADQAAEIVRLHRAEWAGHRGLFPLKDLAGDFDKGKRAKIAAEMVALRQRAERKAWNLDGDNEDTTEIIIERSYGI